METIERPEIDSDINYLSRRALRLYIDGHERIAIKTARQALLLEDCAVIYREQRIPRKV